MIGGVVLTVRFAALGFLADLAGLAVAGFLTEWYVRRRESAGEAHILLAEHRITLDDGTQPELLEGENAVKPGPTPLLAQKYAAAWSSRPEAVVRVAPALLRAIGLDVVGLVAGTGVLIGLIVLLRAW